MCHHKSIITIYVNICLHHRQKSSAFYLNSMHSELAKCLWLFIPNVTTADSVFLLETVMKVEGSAAILFAPFITYMQSYKIRIFIIIV